MKKGCPELIGLLEKTSQKKLLGAWGRLESHCASIGEEYAQKNQQKSPGKGKEKTKNS